LSSHTIDLIVDTQLPRSARWAIEELIRALGSRGESVRRRAAPGADPCLTIGLADQSAAIDEALGASGVHCPRDPESLALHRVSPSRLVVAGRDERGLTYALLEAARAVELAAPEASVLDAIPSAVESPHLAWRSLQLFLCNRQLEREWFYSEVFWDEYLSRLAHCRYNNLSLTFGHQIAYLSPPYPFLVDVPEFPQVRPLDFTQQERDQHLEMLARIASMTRQRGLHFTFAVWSQHAHSYGEPVVDGLTAQILDPYNAAGLARVLAACPEIDGVQFRMNVESGVAEDRQAEFYEPSSAPSPTAAAPSAWTCAPRASPTPPSSSPAASSPTPSSPPSTGASIWACPTPCPPSSSTTAITTVATAPGICSASPAPTHLSTASGAPAASAFCSGATRNGSGVSPSRAHPSVSASRSWPP